MERFPTEVITKIIKSLDVKALWELGSALQNDVKYDEVVQLIKRQNCLICIGSAKNQLDTHDSSCSGLSVKPKYYTFTTAVPVLQFFNKVNVYLFLDQMNLEERLHLIDIFQLYNHKLNNISFHFGRIEFDDMLVFDGLYQKIVKLHSHHYDPRINKSALFRSLVGLQVLQIGLDNRTIMDFSSTNLKFVQAYDTRFGRLPLTLSALYITDCDLTSYRGPTPALKIAKILYCKGSGRFADNLIASSKGTITYFQLEFSPQVVYPTESFDVANVLKCQQLSQISALDLLDECKIDLSTFPKSSPHVKDVYIKYYRINRYFKCLDSLINLQILEISVLHINDKPGKFHFPSNLKCLVIASVQSTDGVDLDWKSIEIPTTLQALTWRGGGFKNVPDNLPKSLTYLNLASNKIEIVPQFKKFKQLQHLRFDGNKIKDLIIKAPYLVDITYSGNPIKRLILPPNAKAISPDDIHDSSEMVPTRGGNFITLS